MTAGGELPERVLVVWCPGWPEAGQETGAAGDDAGPGGGAAPGAGQRAHRAPDFGQVVSVVEEFCPRVEVLRPGACAIGVRGPARYFGGEGALAAKIIDAVAAAAAPAGWVSPTAFSPRASRPGPPGPCPRRPRHTRARPR